MIKSLFYVKNNMISSLLHCQEIIIKTRENFANFGLQNKVTLIYYDFSIFSIFAVVLRLNHYFMKKNILVLCSIVRELSILL